MALLATGAALTMAGCSFSFSIGGSEVSTDDLESRINASYERQTGIPLATVSCEAAAAEVGEPISCQAANERGVELTIAGEITGVNEDDDQVKFNWEVAQAVAPGATFSQAAKETLEETVGEPLTAVRCPDRIPLRRGAELRCTVETSTGEVFGARLTLTDEDGGFRIEVDESARA